MIFTALPEHINALNRIFYGMQFIAGREYDTNDWYIMPGQTHPSDLAILAEIDSDRYLYWQRTTDTTPRGHIYGPPIKLKQVSRLPPLTRKRGRPVEYHAVESVKIPA